MGDTKDKSKRSLFQVPTSLIPEYAYDPYGRQRRPLLQQPSWWQLCRAWLQYHSIQLRWDVERSLARLLKRRWGV